MNLLAGRPIRCNSGTDGTVRMGKDFFFLAAFLLGGKGDFLRPSPVFGFRKFLFVRRKHP